ncbi:IclR family transcriptional regulator [Variovorax boronicumulans]|uniref:IclR family transcriptional regulator n=1 Tax=Variovorax boronicumulans TaxID=436515 RepID=UPI001C59AD1F
MAKKTIQTTGTKSRSKAEPTPAPVEPGADSPLMVNSVQKAFRILMAFSRTESRLTLTQIVDKLGIDKSTAQRFTHTLLVMGYLDKDPVTKTLGVTVKLVDLAHIYLSSNPLIGAAMPYLVHLNGETGETVNLTVLDGTEVVFVSRVVGNHLLSTGVSIGTRLPAFATASGLAMLAALGESEARSLIAASDLRPFAPLTVYEPAKIMDRLKTIRAKGYALSVGDYFPNDISLGAPIVSRNGRILGGISLSGSTDRLSAKDVESKFSKLVSAAAKSVML